MEENKLHEVSQAPAKDGSDKHKFTEERPDKHGNVIRMPSEGTTFILVGTKFQVVKSKGMTITATAVGRDE